MKNFIFSLFILSILSSCVSRGNYLSLQQKHNTLANENIELTKQAANSQRNYQKLQDEHQALQTYSTESIDAYQKQVKQLEKDLQHSQFALQQSNKIKDSLLTKKNLLEKGVWQANASLYKSLQTDVLLKIDTNKLASQLKEKHIELSWQEQQWNEAEFEQQLKAILGNLKQQSSIYEKLTLVFIMPNMEVSNWWQKAKQVQEIIKQNNLQNTIQFLFKTDNITYINNNTALHLLISTQTENL